MLNHQLTWNFATCGTHTFSTPVRQTRLRYTRIMSLILVLIISEYRILAAMGS